MEILSGQDLLIAVRSGLQKADGFYTDSFEDEEIALYLNQVQDQFMDDIINEKFETAAVRQDYIRPFLKSSQLTATNLARFATVELPADYRNSIGAYANITVSTTNYSPNGTRRECLADIDDPLNVSNPVSDTFPITILEISKPGDRTLNLFHKSNYRQPFAEVVQSQMRIYRDKSFIITSVDLDYIIIPPVIDVTSTSNTLWERNANKRLVDLTVERLKVVIENQDSQRFTQMEQIRNQQ